MGQARPADWPINKIASNRRRPLPMRGQGPPTSNCRSSRPFTKLVYRRSPQLRDQRDSFDQLSRLIATATTDNEWIPTSNSGSYRMRPAVDTGEIRPETL